jgi:predicted RNA-binding Zn ribbon-like protein
VIFEYLGGDLAADLVNTAGPTAGEQLTDYSRLLEWAEGAGAISADRSAALSRLAKERPTDATAAIHEARRLREILRTVFREVIAQRVPDLAPLNAELARVLPWRRLGQGEWIWLNAERELESPLWPVVLAAANLLTSGDAERLRLCAKDDCGWVFVDRSRNGLRRWCDMKACGTAEKSRRRAQRSRGAKT